MRSPAIALAMLLFASLPLPAATIGDTEIPDTVTIPGGDSTLLLNGAGIREKFFLDIYVGALYLERPLHDPAVILADEGPASILMHFVYSEVGKDKITQGWTDGLRANLDAARMRLIRPRLEQFNALFRSAVKGDVVRIDYLPGSGTQVRINDELRGSVPGNDFFRDLLNIWLGPSPVSRSLKHDLLGSD